MSAPVPTPATVLALLAADAAEEDLRSALAVAGRDDPELVDAAWAVHRARREDRRRAVELGALSESATDLAGHRDLDELLLAICRRSRLLLGTDVAYVTLSDPERGDTYVRTTDGIISEAFRTLRLPTGVGIGGLVAQTGRPEETAAYPADERLAHSGDVDRRVRAEGLRAIVAAPLTRGGESFGVLMSASRAIRRFQTHEVALLHSLAAHAAVAIENARLLAASRRAVAELADAHALAQAHAARVERIGVARDRLAQVALAGGGLQELVDAAHGSLGGSLEVRDAGGDVLARAGPRLDSAQLEVRLPGGPDDLGTLRVEVGGDDGIVGEVTDRLAGLAAGVLRHQRAQSEAKYRRHAQLLDDLLNGRSSDDDAARRWLTHAGVDVEAPQVVLAMAPAPSAERWTWLVAARAASAEHGLAGTVSGRVVVVVPGIDADAAGRRWATLMRGPDGEPPTVGAAPSPGGLVGLAAAYRDAAGALGVLLALGHAGRAATVAQLGIFGHMLGRSARLDLPRYLTRTLGPLLERDGQRDRDLLTTLEVFLAESGQLAPSARRLHVHINTLRQRLGAVDRLLGVDWRTPDRRLELHLALRLRALDAQLRRDGVGSP